MGTPLVFILFINDYRGWSLKRDIGSCRKYKGLKCVKSWLIAGP